MSTKTARRKRCKYCEELKPADEVAGGICEECCDYHVYCDICGEYIHEDDRHRHINWCNGVGWCGCGYQSGINWDGHKGSVHAFLDRLAAIPQDRLICRIPDYGNATFDELLERFIGANNCWTFTHGFMMSTPDIDFRHEVGGGFCPPFLSIRADDVDAMQEEDLALGWAWLSSLDDKSKDANATTVRWIREWRSVPCAGPPRSNSTNPAQTPEDGNDVRRITRRGMVPDHDEPRRGQDQDRVPLLEVGPP